SGARGAPGAGDVPAPPRGRRDPGRALAGPPAGWPRDGVVRRRPDRRVRPLVARRGAALFARDRLAARRRRVAPGQRHLGSHLVAPDPWSGGISNISSKPTMGRLYRGWLTGVGCQAFF